jgi:hypothetical protein
MPSDLTPALHYDYSPPFTHGDNGSMNPNLHSHRRYTIHEVGPQQGYSTGTSNPTPMYDQTQGNPYTNASSPVSFRSGSSCQPPLSFGGAGPVGHFAPNSYHSNFDNHNLQGSMLGVSVAPNQPMDNTGDMNCSIPASSGDMMYDAKPQIGNDLQQPFGNPQAQGQEWHHVNGADANGAPFWQPDYKTYYST